MSEIYVIVENVPVAERGEYNVEPVLCSGLGYFVDEIQAEAKADALNAKQVAKMREIGLTEGDDDWIEDRFGFVIVNPAQDDPAARRKVQSKIGGGEPRVVKALLCDAEPEKNFAADGYELEDVV